jgi:hypothetical protein
MSLINKRKFWQKVSNYSALVCGTSLVLNIVFKKYAIEYKFEVLIFGSIVVSIFLLSEIMKLILKRKLNSNRDIIT